MISKGSIKILSDDNYVGIKYEKNILKFYLPHGYRVPLDNVQTQKREILKILSLIKRNSQKISYGNPNIEKTGMFFTMYWLIVNFIEKGIYETYKYTDKNNCVGKINWKKTISQTPYISNNNVVYLDVYSKNRVKENKVIQNIHLYCVDESIKRIGWLLNISDSIDYSLKSIKKNYLIREINNEINNTNIVYKKEQLFHMKSFIEELSSEEGDKSFIAGLNTFHPLWEIIIDELFKQYKIEYDNPYVTWDLIGLDKRKVSLFPDTVIKHNNTVYILDAKYYKYGINPVRTNLPASDSITKQTIYLNEMYKQFKDRGYNFINVFIMPYNKKDNKFNSEETFLNIGYNNQSWLEDKIQIILLDTRDAIEMYKNKLTVDKFFEVIE